MSVTQRIASRYKALSRDLVSSMALPHHVRVQGHCSHCAADTPWAARPINGFYRCLRCGNNPFDASHRDDE